jgi:uncharacterized membrane protein
MMGTEQNKGIPLPIVNLNRWVLVLGVVGGLLLQQPLFTTVLLVIVLSAVLFGRQGSLILQVGKRLLAGQATLAQREGRVEDPRLMRFNNTIAAVLLGGAQIAFLFGQNVVGWALSLAVAVAAVVALAGFCIGCSLYFRYKIHRYRRSEKAKQGRPDGLET